MTLADLEADGPIQAQISVRAPEKPQCRDHQECPTPGNEWRKIIIGETQQGGEDIKNGQENAGRDDNGEEDLLQRVDSADGFLIRFGPPGEHAPDAQIDDETDQESNVPHLIAKSCHKSTRG